MITTPFLNWRTRHRVDRVGTHGNLSFDLLRAGDRDNRYQKRRDSETNFAAEELTAVSFVAHLPLRLRNNDRLTSRRGRRRSRQ